MIKGKKSKSVLGIAAFALALGAVLISAGPAAAMTTTISGAQGEDSQVYWGSTPRYNTFASNGMSVSPYHGTSCATPTLLVGARSTAAAGSSFAKTGTMSAGQTSAFKNVSTGLYSVPAGPFYLTTYLGLSGGCVDETPEWTITLIYNVSN